MLDYPRCILASCVVPWDDDGHFLETVFRRQVAALATNLTRNLYIFGTAGEGYAVDERQFDEVTRAFLDESRRCNVEPMVGVISLSLPTIVGRIERCREWGVRDFQISLPAWGALDDRELASFFQETCGRFPDCRFLHYNLRRSQRLLTPDDYVRLAAMHPNLTASKFTSADADTILDLHALTPRIRYFYGERGYKLGCPSGEPGLLASVATINFARCKQFFSAGIAGDAQELATHATELEQLTKLLRTVVGDAPRIDGTYDKLLWALHDESFPLRLLPPYIGSQPTDVRQLRSMIAEQLPHWTPESIASPKSP